MLIETRFEYEMTERLVRALERIANELEKINKEKEDGKGTTDDAIRHEV